MKYDIAHKGIGRLEKMKSAAEKLKFIENFYEMFHDRKFRTFRFIEFLIPELNVATFLKPNLSCNQNVFKKFHVHNRNFSDSKTC